MARELIMYSRTLGCPFITTARRVLEGYDVAYRELYIDRDPQARERVLAWTGFLSVPTLVVAESGEEVPYTDPAPLAAGASPRGVDRGSMLTEPGEEQLKAWLQRHGFIQERIEES